MTVLHSEHNPDEGRVPRLSLHMAFWGIISAMFFLYLGQASNAAYGTKNAIIGIVLSILTFGIVGIIFSSRGISTGESVGQIWRRMFGPMGAKLAVLLLGAIAIYYAVFEGSVIAMALHVYCGGSLELWYVVICGGSVPLVFGGVQNWLDRLNGALLPVFVVGIAAAVVMATHHHGYPASWLSLPAPPNLVLPGWLSVYMMNMDVWVLMMYTIEFAPNGKTKDITYHSRVTFGWAFYIIVFGVDALAGIYLISATGATNAESGMIVALIDSLGVWGLIVIVVSQARINSANYYAASTNLEEFVEQCTGRRTPRLIWVAVAGVISYLFMLTDVLSYLAVALSWQGVLVTAWVTMVLLWIFLAPNTSGSLQSDQLTSENSKYPVVAWVIASAIGVLALQQTRWAPIAALAPLVTIGTAVLLYVPWLVTAGVRRAVPQSGVRSS